MIADRIDHSMNLETPRGRHHLESELRQRFYMEPPRESGHLPEESTIAVLKESARAGHLNILLPECVGVRLAVWQKSRREPAEIHLQPGHASKKSVNNDIEICRF